MSAPITGAEIAALRLWRWHPRLTSMLHGHAFVLRGISDAEVVRQLAEMGAEPDPEDPLLPGWLLHLLKRRIVPRSAWFVGPMPHRDLPARVFSAEFGWSDEVEILGSGPTELHALVDALRRAS